MILTRNLEEIKPYIYKYYTVKGSHKLSGTNLTLDQILGCLKKRVLWYKACHLSVELEHEKDVYSNMAWPNTVNKHFIAWLDT